MVHETFYYEQLYEDDETLIWHSSPHIQLITLCMVTGTILHTSHHHIRDRKCSEITSIWHNKDAKRLTIAYGTGTYDQNLYISTCHKALLYPVNGILGIRHIIKHISLTCHLTLFIIFWTTSCMQNEHYSYIIISTSWNHYDLKWPMP